MRERRCGVSEPNWDLDQEEADELLRYHVSAIEELVSAIDRETRSSGDRNKRLVHVQHLCLRAEKLEQLRLLMNELRANEDRQAQVRS